MKLMFSGMMTGSIAALAGLGFAAAGGFDSSDNAAASAQSPATGDNPSLARRAYLPDANRKFPERVLWGDQHVHTGWSGDAGLAGATLGPEEALRFARGEEIKSSSGVMMKLQRPLDWVAVTDHAEAMGAINELRVGNPEIIADPTAKRWYEMMNSGDPAQAQDAMLEAVEAQARGKLPSVVTDPKWAVSTWKKILDLDEKYNQPGTFTALIGYEWTSNGEQGENMHRNVIFRDGADKAGAMLPLTPFTSSAPGRKGTDPESLWAWLANWEAKTGGRVLAIPHNGNLSNGWMFREARYDGSPMTSEWAATRARWERLFELFQYKGSSEAHPALGSNDELSNFGIWDSGDLNGNAKPAGAISHEYWRNALQYGMRAQGSLGTNPFKLGAAGGTDTHTGLMTGGDNEANFGGKFVGGEPRADRWEKLYLKYADGYVRKDWTLMNQGSTGVWATSNTRAAIWDAMYRRETYASSGPRMTVRFFGGFDFTDRDASNTLVATGYAKGVPMGGDLKAAPRGKAPTFLFAAMKDPDGANLDRIQIVKGWVDAAGKVHEKIFDVSWSDGRKKNAKGVLPAVGNTVDLKTARYTNSIGSTQFVGVFRDPSFDPRLKAFYYARVIEIPTPRWTLYDAVRYKVKMAPEVPMTLQERVVTSPIWYSPT